MDEAHLSRAHIVAGIERFAQERELRRSFGQGFSY
jgi:hypothetical protein